MDENRRQFILSDVARSIERRGWAELSREMSDQLFNSAHEMKQFVFKHNCEISVSPAGGVMLKRTSSLAAHE